MGEKYIDLTPEKKTDWSKIWFSRSTVVDPAKPVIVQPNTLTLVPASGYKQGTGKPISNFAQYSDITPWRSFLTTAINVKISGFLSFSFDISGFREVRIKHTTRGTEIFNFEIFNSSYPFIETRNAVKELNQSTTVGFYREKFAFNTSDWDEESFSEQISMEALHSSPIPLQILGAQMTLSIEGETLT